MALLRKNSDFKETDAFRSIMKTTLILILHTTCKYTLMKQALEMNIHFSKRMVKTISSFTTNPQSREYEKKTYMNYLFLSLVPQLIDSTKLHIIEHSIEALTVSTDLRH